VSNIEIPKYTFYYEIQLFIWTIFRSDSKRVRYFRYICPSVYDRVQNHSYEFHKLLRYFQLFFNLLKAIKLSFTCILSVSYSRD